MYTEPAVEELHRIREKMLEECNGDLNELFKKLQAQEREHPEQVIPAPALKNWKLPKVESEPVA